MIQVAERVNNRFSQMTMLSTNPWTFKLVYFYQEKGIFHLELNSGTFRRLSFR